MGFSFVTGLETIMHADNASFDGTSRGGAMTTNAQLWIGSTAARHVKVGTLTSPDSSITFGYSSPNITAVVNGAIVGQTITGDSGGALSPTAGNWNILGQQAGTIPVVDTLGTAPSTLRIEDRTWVSSFVVDPSTTIGLRGTFSTIQSAINAASAGQTIFIRAGTYVETLTLKDGVSLVGIFPSNFAGGDSGVYISGNITYNSAGVIGQCAISNCTLEGLTSTFTFTAGLMTFTNCYLKDMLFSLTSSAYLTLVRCNGTVGKAMFTSAGQVNIYDCSFASVGSLSASTFTGGTFQVYNSLLALPISCSGAVVPIGFNTSFGIPSLSTPAALTTANGGTFYNCQFNSSNESIIVNGGTVVAVNCVLSSGGTNCVSGAGTFSYANCSLVGAGKVIASTGQVPLIQSNDAVKITTPGAYPYTTIPQDAVILVDSSSARTIIPLASPTTGQRHRIKDNIGSAASNNITITPSGKNIDGAASFVIATNWGSVDIVFNGTQWNIL